MHIELELRSEIPIDKFDYYKDLFTTKYTLESHTDLYSRLTEKDDFLIESEEDLKKLENLLEEVRL